MFVFSKFIHFLAHPANLLLILAALALVLRALRRRGAAALFWFAALYAVATGLTPLGEAMNHAIENRVAPGVVEPERLKGVIVLGGAAGEPKSALDANAYTLNDRVERLTTIVALRRAYPDLPILFTSGDASLTGDGVAESVFAERFLADMGVDTDTILFERRSRNTYENALYSAELLKERFEGDWPGPYLLVTSALHMPRSLGTFRRMGYDVVPYPVDFSASAPSWDLYRFNPARRFNEFSVATRELIGMIYYRVRGWSDAWIPDDQ